ncbi:hypothetical protein ABZ177_26845 [Streptomyces sp. NPDC006284]|uniref:hypothetical protein n=1 Tax=unclassified Streptomyces TaxID=2593676 RepID=UPI0033BDECEA
MTGDGTRARVAPVATQAEGYLLLRAEQERARSEAAALCARLPWLTGGQAEDLTRHYTAQRLDLTRRMLRSTARRADQLRAEYEARYLALRRTLLRRHAAAASATVAAAGTVVAVAYLTAR